MRHGTPFDAPELRRRKTDLDSRMGQPRFWDDTESAQKTVTELKSVTRLLEPLQRLEEHVDELKVLAELIGEESDPELEGELTRKVASTADELNRFELQAVMCGPDDARDVFFSIQAGAGGTESCDWAQMLLRMYSHYFDNNGYSYRPVDLVPNEEAGIKSATLDVKGPLAFGYLKAEVGVHRLVRISPFDSAKRRHTSFASVDVIPQFEEEGEVEISDSEIEIQFYHASEIGRAHV